MYSIVTILFSLEEDIRSVELTAIQQTLKISKIARKRSYLKKLRFSSFLEDFSFFLFFSSSIFRRTFLLGRLPIVGLSGEDISYSFCHNIFPCVKDNTFEMTANISNELHNIWLCNISNECKVVKGNISPCIQVRVFFGIIKLNTINTSENTKHIFRTTPLKQY